MNAHVEKKGLRHPKTHTCIKKLHIHVNQVITLTHEDFTMT